MSQGHTVRRGIIISDVFREVVVFTSVVPLLFIRISLFRVATYS
jgi:hypothetical protein